MGLLAVSLWGREALAWTRDAYAPPYRLEQFGPHCRVFLRRGMSDAALVPTIARAIGLWWLTREGESVDVALHDELVAHIVVPLPALRARCARYGADADAIAAAFVCSRELVIAQMRLLLRPLRGCGEPPAAAFALVRPKIVARRG